jgi:hypothetical protein
MAAVRAGVPRGGIPHFLMLCRVIHGQNRASRRPKALYPEARIETVLSKHTVMPRSALLLHVARSRPDGVGAWVFGRIFPACHVRRWKEMSPLGWVLVV